MEKTTLNNTIKANNVKAKETKKESKINTCIKLMGINENEKIYKNGRLINENMVISKGNEFIYNTLKTLIKDKKIGYRFSLNTIQKELIKEVNDIAIIKQYMADVTNIIKVIGYITLLDKKANIEPRLNTISGIWEFIIVKNNVYYELKKVSVNDKVINYNQKLLDCFAKCNKELDFNKIDNDVINMVINSLMDKMHK